MEKSVTTGRYLYDDDVIVLKNITSLNVSNYSDVQMFVTMDDVTETLPAFAGDIPFAFQIKGDGTFSDIEIKIEFDTSFKSTKSNFGVLRFKRLITNQKLNINQNC